MVWCGDVFVFVVGLVWFIVFCVFVLCGACASVFKCVRLCVRDQRCFSVPHTLEYKDNDITNHTHHSKTHNPMISQTQHIAAHHTDNVTQTNKTHTHRF